MKFLIHIQNSTLQPWKFGNANVSHILQWMYWSPTSLMPHIPRGGTERVQTYSYSQVLLVDQKKPVLPTTHAMKNHSTTLQQSEHIYFIFNITSDKQFKFKSNKDPWGCKCEGIADLIQKKRGHTVLQSPDNTLTLASNFNYAVLKSTKEGRIRIIYQIKTHLCSIVHPMRVHEKFGIGT